MNGNNPTNRFYGKYRGTVFSNADPKFLGRIQAMVPDVLGAVPSTWATPCVPITGVPGLQSGMYVVPPLQASVWIEFEQGDPDYPIWSGCFWGSQAEVPPLGLAGTPPSPSILLQTAAQNTLLLSGDPVTGITLKLATGAGIVINQAGVVITNGKGATIAMVGNTVSINGTALVVT